MENNNPSTKDQEQTGTPPVTSTANDQDQGSSVDKDKQAEAYRKQQSRADKAESDKDEMAERLNFLEAQAMIGMRDSAVKEFLSENSNKYPNVSTDDLVRFASSPDDLEDTAKYLQKKHDETKESVLAAAREVPEESITAEQKAKELKELEQSNDPNRFSKFLRLQSLKVRK